MRRWKRIGWMLFFLKWSLQWSINRRLHLRFLPFIPGKSFSYEGSQSVNQAIFGRRINTFENVMLRQQMEATFWCEKGLEE